IAPELVSRGSPILPSVVPLPPLQTTTRLRCRRIPSHHGARPSSRCGRSAETNPPRNKNQERGCDALQSPCGRVDSLRPRRHRVDRLDHRPLWARVRSGGPTERVFGHRLRATHHRPPDGARVTPANANLMPKIVSPAGLPAIKTGTGAHHYRFVGIEVKPASGVVVWDLIALGTGVEHLDSDLPHDIIFDRCYIH